MTKRTEEKEVFLAALRGDEVARRKCTEKGKPCGGRCIPKTWNCRIKGEGNTPPTRGNSVQLSPEQKEKLSKVRRNRRYRRALSVAGGIAAVGAAVGGAAVLGAKNPAKARRLSRKLATGGTSEVLGVASVLGGPAAAGIAGVANVGVAGFQAGANLGAGRAQRRRALGLFKKLTRQRVQLNSQLKPVKQAYDRAQSKVIKAQERVGTQQSIVDAAKTAMKRKGTAPKGYAVGKSPRSIAQTDRTRINNLKRAETGLRNANKALNSATRELTPRKTAYESLQRKINSVTWKASKLKTGLTNTSNPIRSTLNSTLSASRSKFRSGRRQVTGIFRSKNKRGPKPDKRSWQERFGLDEAEQSATKTDKVSTREAAKINAAKTLVSADGVARIRRDAGEKRLGKPCGNSHISKKKTCRIQKGTGWRKVATAAAIGGAVVLGGVMAKKKWEEMDEENREKFVKEIIADGKTSPAFEAIRKRRDREWLKKCGDNAGKTLPPRRSDSFTGDFCRAGGGSFASYFVDNSETVGFKRFKDEDDFANNQREFDVHKAAWEAGVPTTEPLKLVQIEGRNVLAMRHLKDHKVSTTLGDTYTLGAKASLKTKLSTSKAFEKLHLAKIAHNDQHSDNVMISRAGEAKIIDYGISTFTNDDNGTRSFIGDIEQTSYFVGMDKNRTIDFNKRNAGILTKLEGLVEANNRGEANWDQASKLISNYHTNLRREIRKDMAKGLRPRTITVKPIQPTIPGLTRSRNTGFIPALGS